MTKKAARSCMLAALVMVVALAQREAWAAPIIVTFMDIDVGGVEQPVSIQVTNPNAGVATVQQVCTSTNSIELCTGAVIFANLVAVANRNILVNSLEGPSTTPSLGNLSDQSLLNASMNTSVVRFCFASDPAGAAFNARCDNNVSGGRVVAEMNPFTGPVGQITSPGPGKFDLQFTPETVDALVQFRIQSTPEPTVPSALASSAVASALASNAVASNPEPATVVLFG